jgi:hypothetical protein
MCEVWEAQAWLVLEMYASALPDNYCKRVADLVNNAGEMLLTVLSARISPPARAGSGSSTSLSWTVMP